MEETEKSNIHKIDVPGEENNKDAKQRSSSSRKLF